ncbi:MAG: hypothetical protein ACLQPD_13895 [Desulfomonilaceae bacterium]
MKQRQGHLPVDFNIDTAGAWNEEIISAGLPRKAYCKRDITNFLRQVKAYEQKHQIPEKYLSLFYISALAYYLDCFVETEIQEKMAKWSNRFFGSWVDY